MCIIIYFINNNLFHLWSYNKIIQTFHVFNVFIVNEWMETIVYNCVDKHSIFVSIVMKKN